MPRLEHESDAYFQSIEMAGPLSFGWQGGLHEMAFLIHTSEEEYGPENKPGLQRSPLRPEGRYVSLHAKPCVLVPRYALSAAGSPTAKPGQLKAGGAAAERHPFGNAQAWFYPADQVIELWECEVSYPWSREDPNEDSVLLTVWERFEQLLGRHFPAARQIITPDWEPAYEREAWRRFLRGRGYLPGSAAERSFQKLLRR